MAEKAVRNQRRELTPDIEEAWRNFSRTVLKAGALDTKTKQLIALAVAHVTQCPFCIRGHSLGAQREGASEQEMMEAIWVAAEMRAGGAVAHSHLAFEALQSK